MCTVLQPQYQRSMLCGGENNRSYQCDYWSTIGGLTLFFFLAFWSQWGQKLFKVVFKYFMFIIGSIPAQWIQGVIMQIFMIGFHVRLGSYLFKSNHFDNLGLRMITATATTIHLVKSA